MNANIPHQLLNSTHYNFHKKIFKRFCAVTGAQTIHRPKKKQAEKFSFKLSNVVEQDILEQKYTAKNHPGIMGLKSVKVPYKLQMAANIVFQEFENVDIRKESESLWNCLRHREVPVEEDIKERMKDKITLDIEKKNPIRPYIDLLSEPDKRELLNDREKRVNRKLHSVAYNWKPITYTPFRCVQYLAVRFAPEFAALNRVFHEIKTRVPDFRPRSVFDFGSGIGTTSWAVDEIWPKGCWEMMSFDPCGDMNDFNNRLLRGGCPESPLDKRPGATNFKNYMPYSDKVPYDLVVSSYSLFEVGNLKSRSKALDVLWRKVAPGGFLVLIEQGSSGGYEMIIQAREFLTHCIKQEKQDGFEGGYIFSPCPHEEFCPRYFSVKTPCSFDVKYTELQINDNTNNFNRETMSFVVFRRGERSQYETYNWPRVLKGKAKLKGHALIPTCNPNGKLLEYCATKRRHGTLCYRVCKSSEKGDLLPIDKINQNVQEDITDSDEE